MLLLIRPKSFGFNQQTSDTNKFQTEDGGTSATEQQEKALDEFNRAVQVLKLHNIEHLVIDDSAQPKKPDAIFPNNWFSTHDRGQIVLYPMQAENRRPERRSDIVGLLTQKYGYTEVIDYSDHERKNEFLEGTGSLVLDRPNRIAFMGRSPRSNYKLAESICAQLDLELISFTPIDNSGNPIYHTNVMLTVGERFVIWCPEVIPDESDRQQFLDYAVEYNKELIEITPEQVAKFAGNMLEVKNKSGNNCLLLSSSARRSLTSSQIFKLRNYCSLLPIPVPTIEKYGGGSIRCMMAEIA